MAEDADAASSQVLRVWTASGKELAALPVEEFGTVKALKRHLQSLCGLPRFQQRLLHEGTDLDDDFRFAGSLNLQLVLLTLSDSFPDCVAGFLSSTVLTFLFLGLLLQPNSRKKTCPYYEGAPEKPR